MNQCLPEVLTGAQFSTYRIGGPIREAYQPTTMDEAMAVLQRVRQSGQTLTVLGWGSNSIISTAGISGVTLITRKLTHIEEKGNNTFVFGAGVHLAKAATVAQKHSLHGAEYMIGIPATIGGAVRMNAGALGQETATVVRYAFLFNLDSGELEIWDRERLAYGYRQSAIDPTRHVVLAAEMTFEPGDHQAITELMEGSVSFRKAHHPTEPNGGSVFRNPPGATCGAMLDALGAKEWVEGGVRVSPLHANFIINTGSGTSTDVLRLMRRMQLAVYQQYGHWIHPENLYLGDPTPEETQLWHALLSPDPVETL
jgi:UDP-N-acetylmuramate dehydrogenase